MEFESNIIADAASNSKPHVVMTPCPLQGHLNSFLKLAKLLHSRGFFVTFVNTDFNHARLLNSRGPHALHGLPDFRFESIPDGLPPSDINATQDIASLCQSTRNNCLLPFKNLLERLNHNASKSNGAVPPVTCLISDVVMSFTIQAAQQLCLPIALYWPASAVSFLAVWHCRTLLHKGLIPFKDESCLTNGCLDTQLDWLPGMKNIRLKDFPSFVRTTDPNDLMLNFVMSEVETSQAFPVIFNTFYELDTDVLNTLSSFLPSLYTIGPLPLLLNQIPHSHLDSIASNLWKEDTQCLKWLQSKKPKSVVYVNFGSITVMSPQQLYEFAWGLANSKKTFLWIIRPDLVNGGSVILSPEFHNETKDRGFIASWCAQEEVLNHPSIGGFLTHCGWNSMTESLCAGVPMACWPFFADQQTNCRYAYTEWGIGIEIDNDVKREDVEKLVIQLMEGEKGKKIRQRVLEWKRIAEEDTKPGGSSYMNLDKLIKEVLLKS
ncbi:7-deoxyloganetin glucosyltransferase-like [Senna tora]|uniref:Glycosyltransferase n=1 Tax=Senna tora TaxID=362788 RepID=A0A834SUK6_9FABA|nr:7-deoxyloganetin glucosyltransferase-like [Senna tora]